MNNVNKKTTSGEKNKKIKILKTSQNIVFHELYKDPEKNIQGLELRLAFYFCSLKEL